MRCAAHRKEIARRIDLAPRRHTCARFATNASRCREHRVGRTPCVYISSSASCNRSTDHAFESCNETSREWWWAPETAAPVHNTRTIRPRSAYVALAVVTNSSQLSATIVMNRTNCFQTRLHELGALYPLVVLHNFDKSLHSTAHFDRAVKIDAPKLGNARYNWTSAGNSHLLKFSIWGLTEYDRLLYIDTDVYLRSLPDKLMHMPLEALLAAVPSCQPDVFNSGFMVLTPDARVAADLFAFRIPHAHGTACTGTFKGDQYWLNRYFRYDWMPLGSAWNTQRKYYGSKVEVATDENTHFVGHSKPNGHLCEHGTFALPIP
jgi:hypothetical protein